MQHRISAPAFSAVTAAAFSPQYSPTASIERSSVIAAPVNPCSRRNAYIFPDSDPGRLSSMQLTRLCDTITTGAPADIPARNGSRSSSVISESGRSSIEIPV